MVTAFISVAVPSLNWMVLGQYPILILSIVCLILLLVEKKEVRAAYGLKFSGKKGAKSWFYVLLFLVLYIVRMLISCLIEGQVNLFIDIFTDPVTYIVMLSLVVSFFFPLRHFLERNMDGDFLSASFTEALWIKGRNYNIRSSLGVVASSY